MNIYKQASRTGLRFNTERGLLTTEQLWSLPRTVIERAIKAVNKILKESQPDGGDDDLDFLNNASNKVTDVENTLRFNILKDIYITKKEEAEAERNAAKIKAHNNRIDELILRKEEEELEGLSKEELLKLRK